MWNILCTVWSLSHISLPFVSILFFPNLAHIVISPMSSLWYLKFWAVVHIICINFIAFLFTPVIFILPRHFALCFSGFWLRFFRLVVLNIIFNLSKNFFIDLNWICMVIQVAFLGFTNPLFLWNHTHVGRFRVNKSLLFLKIRRLDAHLIGPGQQLKHGRILSSVFGRLSKDFLRKIYFRRLDRNLLVKLWGCMH